MATKWGICGTGKIAHDFCVCLTCLPDAEHQIVGVAAGSSKEKAEKFAQEFGIPNSYGSYDELLANDNIDVVYVSVIHPLHVETSLKVINAGKAVLCEKPMAMTLEGCKEVLAAAKKKGVFFMEAIWSRFFPAYAFIKEQMNAGSLGEIKMVEVNFCVPIFSVSRLHDKKLGGGGLLDIGIYVVQAANFVFQEEPEQVWSDGVVCKENGTDKSGIIILRYSGGRFANLVYHTELQAGKSNMVVRGTKGTIEIPDTFWCPDKVVMDGQAKDFPVPDCKPYTVNYGNSEGLTYEAQGVRDCLIKGLKESPHMSHADSESIMAIMQKVLDNFGMKYDAR